MDFKDLHRYSQIIKIISAPIGFSYFFIDIAFNFYYVTTSIFLSISSLAFMASLFIILPMNYKKIGLDELNELRIRLML